MGARLRGSGVVGEELLVGKEFDLNIIAPSQIGQQKRQAQHATCL
jgi:hypothetical protein